MTERLFRDAGIGPGHRVLDVGCGYGTVSRIAASMVGTDGSVVGVDRSSEAIRQAAERARSAGIAHLSFVQAELSRAAEQLGMFDETVHGWIWDTVEGEGADVRMGARLASIVEEAGLDVGHVRAEAVVQRSGFRSNTAAVIRAILPRILRQDVATEPEMDLDTLDARLEEELARTRASYVEAIVFGVWAEALR